MPQCTPTQLNNKKKKKKKNFVAKCNVNDTDQAGRKYSQSTHVILLLKTCVV
jgi:hypothetical protein